MKTVIVTIPGMLLQSDLENLKKVSEVQYIERNEVDEDTLAALATDAEVLMLNYDVVINGCKELSENFWDRPELSKIKVVAFDMTGIDWSSPASANKRGITMLNIPHYSTQSVAESVFAEILLHSRQRHRAYVDEIARGFNMNVIGWNRSPRSNVEILDIPEVFKRADVVVVSLKTVKTGADSNVGIINADALAGANNTIVVNLANRVLVDEAEMAEAIASGRVSAYSLDRNPDSIDGPLGKLEQVHFPPGNAWNSDESMDTLRETWVSNVISYISGKPENVYAD